MTNKQKLIISKVLNVSANHINNKIANDLWLDLYVDAGLLVSHKVVDEYEYLYSGWIIDLKEEVNISELPKELAEIVKIAKENKCSTIFFGLDLPEYDFLPILEWE